jgi:hypothetical protein
MDEKQLSMMSKTGVLWGDAREGSLLQEWHPQTT